MKYELELKGKKYPVKFRHERYIIKIVEEDEEGNDIIVEDLLSKGGSTIAYIKLEEDKVINATCECSMKDVYNKRTGRAISFGRLKSKLQKTDGKKMVEMIAGN